MAWPLCLSPNVHVAKSMRQRTEESQKRLTDAHTALQKLQGTDSKYTLGFFAHQWERQKVVQQDVISATEQKLKKRVGVLLDLEEELLNARCGYSL